MKKAVLITGAGSGIGAAAAHEFHQRGYFVFLLGRTASKLEAVHRDLPNSAVVVCDLQRPEQIEKTIHDLLRTEQGKEIEVLVNNAGIFETHGTLDGTDEIWIRQFEVNLLGPVRLTRSLWPHFLLRKKGTIVNVSSTLGVTPSATTSSYSAIKAAMINWTQALALEGGPHGVRANCVSPGIVDTPIHPFHSQEATEKEKTLASLAGLQPLNRIGKPTEIAKAILYFGTDDSSWTTGANLNVDGGISLT